MQVQGPSRRQVAGPGDDAREAGGGGRGDLGPAQRRRLQVRPGPEEHRGDGAPRERRRGLRDGARRGEHVVPRQRFERLRGRVDRRREAVERQGVARAVGGRGVDTKVRDGRARERDHTTHDSRGPGQSPRGPLGAGRAPRQREARAVARDAEERVHDQLEPRRCNTQNLDGRQPQDYLRAGHGRDLREDRPESDPARAAEGARHGVTAIVLLSPRVRMAAHIGRRGQVVS